jgi:cytochrome d ubiquinol oxidase subunit I
LGISWNILRREGAVDNLLAARIQMAVSLGFHIIFAVIGIGMPLLMAAAEWRWLRGGRPVDLELARRWAKGTAIFFAVGAVSGTVLSFELGLLWPEFMRHAGGIIGFPFSMEGFAFFTEAIFLGVYLYGWNRIGRWAHWGAGVIVAISGATSAMFIVMANGWMNAPAGFDYDPATGVFSNIDPVAAMFNPAWKPLALHMVVAAYLATAFGAAGIHAVQLLRNPSSEFHRRALGLCMTLAVPMALAQPVVGDYAAKATARNQPAKLAAMEGQFQTQRGAPLRIFGIPDTQAGTTNYAIEIPGLLSFLAHGDFNAEVKGLEEFPRDQWPPVAITHIAFQVMVACGVVMLVTGVWYAVAALRGRAAGSRWWRIGQWGMPTGRGLLAAVVVCAPLGFIAIEAGWTVTEVGRQPWVIYGVMRTSEAVTPMPGLVTPMVLFTLVYLGLGAIVAALIAYQVRAAPHRVPATEAALPASAPPPAPPPGPPPAP